jgi:hypothetical protein
MCLIKLIHRIQLPLIVAFATVLGLSLASVGKGAIVGPVPVSFDQKDLDKSLDDSKSGCGSSAPMNSRQIPSDEHGRNSDGLDRLKAALPLSQGSSSSSSSSAGGGATFGAMPCVFNSTAAISDDSPLGCLAEDHGFTLPDPPGLDLLRPPRTMLAV